MFRLLQLTLDLFEGQAPVAPPPKKKTAARRAKSAKPATDSVADQPRAGTLGDLLVPARFTHPRANRQALLDDTAVGYLLRRARRRTIGFQVGADGLVVAAPRWVGQAEIDLALREKARWIVRKLHEAHQRAQQLEAARIDWKDGAVFSFLGQPVTVVLDASHGFAEVGACFDAAGARLALALPGHATPEQIRDAVQAWLMRQATRVFTERLAHFAPLLGVRWRVLRLSNAGTRWGSAHADGTIRLHWRLMHFGLPVIDYVVAHELAHLRVMDHSPRFWQTVASVVPDYTPLRAQLKDHALPSW